MTSPFTDALAWTVVGLFSAGTVLEAGDRHERARLVTTFAWVLFAGFWLALVPHFAFEQRSIVEGVLSLAAVPACLYTGRELYRGRDSLYVLSRAVAVMGVVYLPATTIEAVRRPLVEMTTRHTEVLMAQLGYRPEVIEGRNLGYRNAFLFTTGGHPYVTEVLLACTGLGSISIFAGLAAAVDAPARRKLAAAAIAVPVIYGLNVVRVGFIALAHGQQWFRSHQWVLVLFGSSDPNMASYFVADRVVSQVLSVVVLVVIALALVRVLPELVVVFEDALYLATGDEYDLQSAVGADPGVRPDGGSASDAGRDAPRDGERRRREPASGATSEPGSDGGPANDASGSTSDLRPGEDADRPSED